MLLTCWHPKSDPRPELFSTDRCEPEYAEFLANPEKFLLSLLPNQAESTLLISTVSLLATHSRDEEDIGERRQNWTDDERALRAFDKFSAAVRAIVVEISKRNRDSNLKPRNGAGVIPYELLHPRLLVIDKDGREILAPGLTAQGCANPSKPRTFVICKSLLLTRLSPCVRQCRHKETYAGRVGKANQMTNCH